MKKLSLFLILLVFSVISFGQDHYCREHKNRTGEGFSDLRAANSRSDTIDILNYTISLNITDFTGQSVSGNCAITYTPKINGVDRLDLDLLVLNIDSITHNGNLLSYVYDDTLIRITTPAFNIADTATVTVYYNGNPQTDPSAYGGGFYFSGNNYAYNIGVGFEVDPHVFGRSWFPCFDNFVERSTYEFFITTDTAKKAFCNGLLQDTVHTTDTTVVWHWKMNQTIPTYLASVAVANYATVNWSHNGMTGTIPIHLNALAGDTNKMKTEFQHLPDAIDIYENSYGPHQFDRIGYNLVPIVGGAMEHATNIAYQRALVTSASFLDYETTMAHELAHHWWGDLVTCETAEDMWINEGWASYSEYVFLEKLYGKDEYISNIRSLHYSNLKSLHINEDTFRAVSGVPHAYTYSSHVYDKGADVAHTLRAYLGDSLFFSGVQQFLEDNKFSSVSSADLRDGLSAITGVDLTDFFDNWVFKGGWPQFSIDSFVVNNSSAPYDVDVFVKQRLRGAPSYYTNVPMEVTFMADDWQKETRQITVSGSQSSASVSLDILPEIAWLNDSFKISQAVTVHEEVYTTTGTKYLSNAVHWDKINLLSVTDSVFLRMEHNWAAPDLFKKPWVMKMQLSEDHYWRLTGQFPGGLHASAQLKVTKSSASGKLDHSILQNSEDSLFFLHRPDAGFDWEVFPYSTINTLGNLSDGLALIEIDSLLPGEYALAWGYIDSSAIQIVPVIAPDHQFKIYPNPGSGQLNFEYNTDETCELRIMNANGRLINKYALQKGKDTLKINDPLLKSGVYYYTVVEKEKQIGNGKFVVVR